MMSEDRIAVYIRLSNADEDTGKGKDESNSVVNQRSLIHSFLDSSEELSRIPRQEFVDDGFTGTNTDRPAFQDMIRQIRDGHFNICITKDFSRFSRDYIEMGDYLECLFPFLRVRYISINDNYDSKDYKGTTGGLDVVMRSIVYDAYSKDLSAKVKTAQIQCAKKGRRVHGLPGFGYMPDPNNKCMDIVDPEAAKVVRKIFNHAIEGKAPAEIADILNREHIPTPGQYFRAKNPNSKKFAGTSDKVRWNYSAVASILDRYAYTGAAVNMKRGAVGPCQKKTVTHPKDEWIIVPGMHEAIVTVEEFEQAQKSIKRKPYGNRQQRIYPLKSIMVCGICGRKLGRLPRHRTKSPRFFCKYGKEYGNIDCKNIRSPREDELHRIVYDGIMDFIRVTEGRMRETAHIKPVSARTEKYLEKCRSSIEGQRRNILKLYEQYAADLISKERFHEQKAGIEADIHGLEQEISDIESISAKDKVSVSTEVEANCRTFKDCKELTYEMTHAFVDKIVVYPDQRIEIKWRFRDNYKDDEIKEAD